MDDKKIDLTPCRPWPKETDFESVVASVVARASATHSQTLSFWDGLLVGFRRLARPMIAVAACLVILAWSSALLRGASESTATIGGAVGDSRVALMNWAVQGNTASTMEMLAVLEGLR
ncbi:MAG: hypothetical protein H6707_14735 [Deltaproteobacteria bacterium]|nr:hypothetical protein [Deltaproteobacteria bacterium]